MDEQWSGASDGAALVECDYFGFDVEGVCYPVVDVEYQGASFCVIVDPRGGKSKAKSNAEGWFALHNIPLELQSHYIVFQGNQIFFMQNDHHEVCEKGVMVYADNRGKRIKLAKTISSSPWFQRAKQAMPFTSMHGYVDFGTLDLQQALNTETIFLTRFTSAQPPPSVTTTTAKNQDVAMSNSRDEDQADMEFTGGEHSEGPPEDPDQWALSSILKNVDIIQQEIGAVVSTLEADDKDSKVLPPLHTALDMAKGILSHHDVPSP